MAEVREEWLSGRRVREGCEAFLVESIIEVVYKYRPDATCVTLKDIPLGLRKGSPKRILRGMTAEESRSPSDKV
jgi:hypothetical protein